MPMLDLQKLVHEVGRIRIGRRDAAGGPEKLSVFRFTGTDPARLAAVARLYGGRVDPWTNPGSRSLEYEVVSNASRIPVTVLPAARSVESWWMLLDENGAVKRKCDGLENRLTGRACQCPLDPAERTALAEQNRACRPTTTLRVLLSEVAGVGTWRAVSHGYNAAASLPADADLLAAAVGSDVPVPATLSLSRRVAELEDGTVSVYYVPVIDTDLTPAELASGATRASRAPAPAPANAAGTSRRSAAQLRARAAAARTTAELEAVLAEAEQAGLARPDGALAGFIRAQRRRIEPAPRVVRPVASSQDPDAVWAAVISAAGEAGWGLTTVREQFARRNEGLHPASASAAQLQGFLTELTEGLVIA